MAGIVKTLEVIRDLRVLAVDSIALVKAAGRGPFGWPELLAKVVMVASDVKEIVADAPEALPELKDVDSAEAGQIATASYDCVKAIVSALAA